jgi:hypothetical protein
MAIRDNTLFALFDAINKGDYAFVDGLTDDQLKSLSPFVLLMWMNGAVDNNEIHVLLTDAVVNEFVFSFSAHPRLLLKMLITANAGIDRTRYQFVKSVGKNEDSIIRKLAKHYECGYDQAKDILPMMSEDDIKELKELYGE